MKNVPKLRFKDENGWDFPAWTTESLLNLSENGFSNGVFNDPSKVGSGYKLVNVSDMYIESTINEMNLTLVNISEPEFKKNKVEKGDIFFTRSSLVKEGIACSNVYLGDSQDITFDGHLVRMRPKKYLINSVFLNYLLKTKEVRKQLIKRGKTATMTTIGQSDIATVNIIFPNISEQTKIANFLTAIDDRITQLTQKVDGLEQYKKAVMQQIFSQKLRFKDEKGRAFGAWEEKRLGDVATRVKRKNIEDNKNVLTISAQQGLINQEEFFKKSVSAKNVTNYYLLHKGEFAYNKSYSNGYPMGAIKCLNRYDKGVVSTLYICFKLNNGNINSFFEHYFESGKHNTEIEKVAQEGARNHGLLNIGLDDFFSISLSVPSRAEQAKIAGFLGAVDEKLAQAKAKLDAVKQYKQGLLQQMFV
jgi:type I restriction enzyme S subunit